MLHDDQGSRQVTLLENVCVEEEVTGGFLLARC